MAWYDEFFDDDYLRTYAALQTPERTTAEVELVVRLLALPAGSRILDLACGQGRHALALARRGFRVTGLDYTPAFLEEARTAAREAGLAVEFLKGDMRALPFREEFDAVISLFTSFGFFGDAEDLEVLQGVARALRPGGRFLLEMVNRDYILRNFRPRRWEEFPGGLLMAEETEYDPFTGHLRCRRILHEGGERREKSFDLRLYSVPELAGLLEQAGMTPREAVASPDGGPFTLDSPRVVLVAERRRDER